MAHGNRKYFFDEHFFDVIDTEEKAYWLGFITADGTLNKTGYSVKITLQRNDRLHLQSFLDALQHTGPVRDHDTLYQNGVSPMSTVVASSKLLHEGLMSRGLMPNKTWVVKPSKSVPINLLRHYWRGCFDGDGCLTKHGQRNYWRMILCGNKQIVDGFHQFALQHVSTKAKPRTNNGKLYHIGYEGNNLVYPIAFLLYDRVTIALKRKAKEYERLKNAHFS